MPRHHGARGAGTGGGINCQSCEAREGEHGTLAAFGVWYRWNARVEVRAIVGSASAKNVGRKGGGPVCGNALDARASPRDYRDMGSLTIECGIVGMVVMRHTRI